MAHLDGAGTSRLQRQGEHTFVAEVDPDYRFLFAVEDDRAEAVTLHMGSRAIPGERKP